MSTDIGLTDLKGPIERYQSTVDRVRDLDRREALRQGRLEGFAIGVAAALLSAAFVVFVFLRAG